MDLKSQLCYREVRLRDGLGIYEYLLGKFAVNGLGLASMVVKGRWMSWHINHI